jgi:hypothetical protein
MRKKICDSKIADISQEECLKVVESSDYEYGMQLLKKEIAKLKETITINNGNNNTNIIGDHIKSNIDNSVHIDIHINSYKDTNYDVLKDNVASCIKNGKVDEVELLKLLHFNEKFPENHNVKIDNKRANRIMAYNGDKFEEKHSGSEGVFDFLEGSMKNIGKQDFVDDEQFVAINNASVENEEPKQKTKKIHEISKILYNGKEMVNGTHTKS